MLGRPAKMKPIKSILIGLSFILSSQFIYGIPQIIENPKIQILDACKSVLAEHNKRKPKSKETSFIIKASYGKLSEVYPKGNVNPDVPLNSRHPKLSDKMGWFVIILRQADLSHKNIYFLTADSKIILLEETT